MSRNDFYYSHLCTPSGRNVAQAASRRGLTLVEILIAVTLMTFIMLAAIQVLTYVSAEMNRARSAMAIASKARTAQLQIERDLACITAPLTPPLRFDDAPGYVQIVEGLGSGYGQLFHKDKDGNDKIGWGLEDIAVNSETGEPDSTIGDCDDILMFTARAPGDQMFRGLVGGEIMESKEAEICYFLRGTTLYRRVLLIIPDEVLQEKLNHPNYSQGAYPARDGYGFYRDFDVSARLERNGGALVVKANTLADLTRRENRFGHAINGDNRIGTIPQFPYGIHTDPSWYHLRLPTLAECTMDDTGNNCSWRVGMQIVPETERYNSLLPASRKRELKYDDKSVISLYSHWPANGDEVSTFPKAAGEPYIDYWNNPLPWNEQKALSTEYQSLTEGTRFYDFASTSTFKFKQRVNEDVLLNNVIGFDIKVWDAETKKFIDLGEYKTNFQLSSTDVTNGTNVAAARDYSKNLGSQGYFGRVFDAPNRCYGNNQANNYLYSLLPCVYDTWTDAYENEIESNAVMGLSGPIKGIANEDGYTDIMEHVDKWRCPPPYNVPLTGIQIKIRVFDPNTNNIREVTIRKNFN